jgi:hypothetical protein
VPAKGDDVTDEEVWAAGGAVAVFTQRADAMHDAFRAWLNDNEPQVSTASWTHRTIRSKGGGIAIFYLATVEPERLYSLELDRVRALTTLPGPLWDILRCRLRGRFARMDAATR